MQVLTSMKRRAKSLFRNATRGAQKRRECPICGWQGFSFLEGGDEKKRRYDCRCPKCGSVERHRLAYMVAEKLAKLDFSTVLHVAPERELAAYLQGKSSDYLSIDLYNDAMAKMDITALELPDDSQSLIWISHVLEHVEDDASAISEMYRVLRPSGMAFVQVPIWRKATYEDFSIQDSVERQKHFYQPDHVRLYGWDIVDRFESQGFVGAMYRAQDFGPEQLLKHGLSFASTDEVFVFSKPADR